MSTSDEEDEDDSDSERDESDEEDSDDSQKVKVVKPKPERINELDEFTKKKESLFEQNVEGQGGSVPDIARKLKKKDRNTERVRYEMTYQNENGEQMGDEPKKSLVIKKKSDPR